MRSARLHSAVVCVEHKQRVGPQPSVLERLSRITNEVIQRSDHRVHSAGHRAVWEVGEALQVLRRDLIRRVDALYGEVPELRLCWLFCSCFYELPGLLAVPAKQSTMSV